MVCIGLKRLPHWPFCGPRLSKFSANEKTFPLRIRRAASTMSFGETLLSVPISSSGPQRPQLLSRLAAALMSSRVILASADFVMRYQLLGGGSFVGGFFVFQGLVFLHFLVIRAVILFEIFVAKRPFARSGGPRLGQHLGIFDGDLIDEIIFAGP